MLFGEFAEGLGDGRPRRASSVVALGRAAYKVKQAWYEGSGLESADEGSFQRLLHLFLVDR